MLTTGCSRGRGRTLGLLLSLGMTLGIAFARVTGPGDLAAEGGVLETRCGISVACRLVS